MATDGPGQPESSTGLLSDVERYYSAKVRRHGPTALGVDWNSPLSQRLRFVQLLKVVEWGCGPIALHDLGCGYGALLEHLQDRHRDADLHYVGTDLSGPMIEHAQRLWRSQRHVRFELAPTCMPAVDYTVASGIFNISLGHGVDSWEQHVAATLGQMHAASARGFAVNFMSPRTLAERPATAGQVYAVEPKRWSGFIADRFGCEVQCIEGYGLSEFTLLAWRTS